MILPEPTRITQLITGALENLHIPYFVGGSLASSFHGIPRATQDVDIVADIRLVHSQPLIEALKREFYIDEEMIRDAIEHHSSFNVIHLETMFKVDIFLMHSNPISIEEMSRRERISLSDNPAGDIYVASAEDIIVNKLRWFQMGEGISERQWIDVLGVLQVQGENLDFSYLQKAAKKMDVQNLLKKAIDAARLGESAQ